MSDTQNAAAGEVLPENQQPLKKLMPVLFIGLGGTGMEVILRIRHRNIYSIALCL